MKFSIITCLIFAVCGVLGADETAQGLDPSLMGSPTQECTDEVAKYQECIQGKADTLDVANEEKINAFCSSFDETKCTDFFNDLNKSESACINLDKLNILDITSGKEAQTVKIQYQVYD